MHRNQELILIRICFCFEKFAMNDKLFLFGFRSPTMAGGLLAAHREYFFEIGGYGKNFEWKFRIDFYGFSF